MHATQLLDTHLREPCQGVHKTRMRTLLVLCAALIVGRKLSVTGLGRAVSSRTYTKHNIKRADRMIGNPHLKRDRILIYQAIAKLIIGRQPRPVILIDWSDLSADREFHLLRAAIPVAGRALTIYEECHHQRVEGHPHVHRRFLQQLKNILPEHCHPVIVTDAGFRTPWFRQVQAMGWDFVGRVGGHLMLSPKEADDWVRVEQVFETATNRGRYLGEIDLVRKQPLTCHAYLMQKKKKGRIKKTVFGQRCAMKHSEKNAHRERTPWLIVTSLNNTYANTQQVLNLYATRMQIEEGFRDVKNSRWGLAFNEARCTSTYRYENLLLIAHLATFAVWLVGKVAELKQWHRHYQANTVRSEKVLSSFFLGLEIIRHMADNFRIKDYLAALRQIRTDHKKVCGYV